MDKRLRIIPEEKKDSHAWQVEVDGKLISFYHARIFNENYQLGMEVGLRAEGYVGPAFYEKGGVITILYTYHEAELLIGLLLENRPNLSAEPVLDAVGGMVDPEESHEHANERETEEEAGVKMQAEPISGYTTWNRLFNFADLKTGAGTVKRYVLEVPFSFLEKQDDASFRFSSLAIKTHGFKAKVVFLPWLEAAEKTPDLIAHGGILGLLAKLRRSNINF